MPRSSSPRARRRRPAPHHHAGHLEHELELLEAEAVLLALAVEAGIVPERASRPPFAHELDARVNFAALELEVDTTAGRLASRLGAARARILSELEDDLLGLAHRTDPHRAIIDHLTDLRDPTRRQTLGARTTGALVDELRPELEAAAIAGHARALSEAVAQGIPVAGVAALDLDALEEELDRSAIRLGRRPLERVIDVAGRYPYENPVYNMTTDAVLEGVRTNVTALSDRPELDEARQEAHKLNGLGRQQAAANLPTMAAVYASELLDGTTCGPCSLVDGRRYASLEGAQVDYPTARYRLCAGGDRCRGTLVFVWSEESEPTIGGDEGPPAPAPELNPSPDATGGDLPAPAAVSWQERLARLRAQRPAEWAPAGAAFDEHAWADDFRARHGGRVPNGDDYQAARQAHDAARFAEAAHHEELVRQAGRVVAEEVDRRLAAVVIDTAAQDAVRAELEAAERTYTEARAAMRRMGGGIGRPRGLSPDDAARYNELADQSNAAVLRIRELRPELDRLEAETGNVAGRITNEVLGEVQEQGPGTLRHRYASGSVKAKGVTPLEDALEVMPRRWIDASVRHSEDVNPLYVGNIQRGHYRNTDYRRVGGRQERISRLNVSGDRPAEMLRVAQHEFGHRVEHVVPEVRRLEHAFYRRRTADAASPTGQEARTWLGSGYGRDEVARADKFVKHYMGKDYGNKPESFYELLSMGLEAVFRGQYGGLAADADMREFILGLLVSV